MASSEKNILFVCSGNICRSPMAEVLCRAFTEATGEPARISSAGTLGIIDRPAAAEARQAVGMLGLDLESHRSRAVTPTLLSAASAIVIMSPEHERGVILRDSEATPRLHRLWEHTSEEGRLEEIDDPIGGDLEDFLSSRDDILECLRNWLPIYLGAP